MSRSPQQIYRIAAPYRRCCWYVMIGFAGIAPVGVWVAQNVQNVPPDRAAMLASAYLLVIVAAMFPLTWSLRVEEEGIRRRWLGLADFWSWDDFASGRLVKRHPYTIVDPQRIWWRRRLRLGWMSVYDIKQLVTIINSHYQLPPPPVVPNPLVLKYGFRRAATFDDNGIHLVIRGVPKEYLWTDVVEVDIIRTEAMRRDFAVLQLRLPSEFIDLKLVTHQGGTTPTWTGATAEEINELIFASVPHDRIHVFIAGEQITRRMFLERALEEAKQTRKGLRIALAIAAVFGCAIGFSVVAQEGWKAMLGPGVMLVVYVPVFALLYRRISRRVPRLASELAAFDEAESP